MDINRIDAERKHLEGLLKDRISFFLLFAPVLVAASYNIRDHPLIRAWVLLTGTVVSLLLALAIYRIITDKPAAAPQVLPYLPSMGVLVGESLLVILCALGCADDRVSPRRG